MLTTCEFVSQKHPDKLCDTLADTVLDAFLAQDPKSRVAIEVLGGHGTITMCGEVTSRATVDVKKLAQDFFKQQDLAVNANIVRQSEYIAQGVLTGGAGDQGIMYGYATNETPEFLPYPYTVVRDVCRKLYQRFPYDGKVQITFKQEVPLTVVASFQHAGSASLLEEVRKIVPAKEYLINPAGEWTVGGFEADTGLTGRKLAIDNYGTTVPVGGGAFSGKDATKVDRSAAYMARFAAKSIVASGYAQKCLVSVAYAIGKAEPVMLHAQDQDKNNISHLLKAFDFRPQAIIERLGLQKPIFSKTATTGHFGHPTFPWEQVVSL